MVWKPSFTGSADATAATAATATAATAIYKSLRTSRSAVNTKLTAWPAAVKSILQHSTRSSTVSAAAAG